MPIAQLESPLFELPLPVFLGSGVASELLAFPGTPAKVRDRVREEAFLWTAAHELRQPLSVMAMAVAVIEREAPSVATANALAIMTRQVRHMSRMVDDLLDAARLSTGKVSLIAQPLDIREVMTDAAADIATAIAERGQQLDVDFGAMPLWTNGDRQRLHQVFSNLLRNAIKFTSRGGRITFTAASTDSRIAVRVGDTGCGIDRTALLRVFDLFAQVQPAGQPGLGIGLSVVREIVNLHRGRIEARSDGLGKGSEFVVTLPGLIEGTT